MLKKLFSHTIIYGLAPHIPKIVSVFTLPLITQKLNSVDYGIMGILTAYTTAISVLATLGLRIVLVNSFFKSPKQYKWAWRQLYGFLSLWSFIYGLIMFALVYFIIPLEAEENKWVILILLVFPIVFFGQTSTIASTYYQLEQKPFQIAIRSVIFGLLTIVFNILFIVNYNMGYMGWFWSSFIVGILTNISYFYPLNFILKITPIFNFKRRLIKNSLKVSLPMIPHYYSSYLLENSDKVIMDMTNIASKDIGRYNVAYTVGNIVNSISIASGFAVSPMVMNLYKEKKDEKTKLLILPLQGVFLSITFLLSIWMKEIFFVLIKNVELSKMYLLGIIIVMSFNYRPMYIAWNNKLIYEEKTSVIWKITLMSGLINVFLNLLLIPFFGFEVAAITTFISYMFMGFAGFFSKSFKEINKVNYYPLLWFFSTILFALISYYLADIQILNKIIVSFFFLIGISFLSVYYFKIYKNEF